MLGAPAWVARVVLPTTRVPRSVAASRAPAGLPSRAGRRQAAAGGPLLGWGVDDPVGTAATSVAVGAFTGDGKPDLATATYSLNTNTVSVLDWRTSRWS
jgi:hypothetical protein